MADGIVVWQPVLTDHQSFTLSALAKVSGLPLEALVLDYDNADRLAQGWRSSLVDGISVTRISTSGRLKQIVERVFYGQNKIFIFCSPFERPVLIFALVLSTFLGRQVFLVSEPYSTIGQGYLADSDGIRNVLKRLLRPLLYRFYGFLLSSRVAGVFAISPLAVCQYARVGYARSKIFDFGYFVPRTEVPSRSSGHVRVIGMKFVYVGSLIRRKGFDLAVSAANVLRSEGLPVTLDLYGSRDSGVLLEESDAVKYRGLIPFGTVQKVLPEYDAVIVPSRFDGWAVVVNEAIHAGVPLVCSDRVGASVMVRNRNLGEIYEGDSVAALVGAMRRAISSTEEYEARRESLARASRDIEPSVAAAYMWARISSPAARGSNGEYPWA